jgi:hypothetical protein
VIVERRASYYQLHRAALGVRHNVAIAIDIAIVWVRQATLLETEGQILGDRYAQSEEFDKACSLRPEARQLSPEDFDPEPTNDAKLPPTLRSFR